MQLRGGIGGERRVWEKRGGERKGKENLDHHLVSFVSLTPYWATRPPVNNLSNRITIWFIYSFINFNVLYLFMCLFDQKYLIIWYSTLFIFHFFYLIIFLSICCSLHSFIYLIFHLFIYIFVNLFYANRVIATLYPMSGPTAMTG